MWSPPGEMVPGARWFCWIDPITYAFRAIVPPHFHCDAAGGAGACPTVQVPGPHGTLVRPLEGFVQGKYDIYYADRWESLGYLALFIIFFQLVTGVAMRYIRHVTR
jgi:hypothetical protein